MSLPTQSELTTTGIADPWSEHGYSNWQDSALNVRRGWMEMMGLSEDEIESACQPGTHADFDEELAEYNAMFRIQKMNEAERSL